MLIELAMLPAALMLDLVFGEPPSVFHPVIWMGKVVGALQRLPVKRPGPQFVYGVFMVVVGVTLFTLPTWALMSYLRQISPIAYFVVGSLLLKSTFSVRALFAAAARVRDNLERGHLELARDDLRSLVSRDRTSLDEPLVVAATVESVAENSGDSFIAPLFYFALFGLPGAIAYRAINTFDSMVGYHGQYEYLGKAAARLDDLANLIPARLAGCLLVASSFIKGKGAGASWRAMRRYRRATESPNAGWPMSAMAGALDIRLEKSGHYRLGDGAVALTPAAIGDGIGLVSTALALAALCCAVLLVVRYVGLP